MISYIILIYHNLRWAKNVLDRFHEIYPWIIQIYITFHGIILCYGKWNMVPPLFFKKRKALQCITHTHARTHKNEVNLKALHCVDTDTWFLH